MMEARERSHLQEQHLQEHYAHQTAETDDEEHNQNNTNHNDTAPRTLAASAATEAEDKIAKEGRHPDGSTAVKAPKRVWRPKVRMAYEEPEALLDTSGDLDCFFEEHGHVAIEDKKPLPPRDDIIEHNPDKNLKEFEKNTQWRGCPEELQIVLRIIIDKYFDVFAEEGMQKHMRGFEFNIDTDATKPTCCKQPACGPHESRVIISLLDTLERKNIVEDDFGPWGSPVVLSSKPDQAHVHWAEFMFRLCACHTER